MDAAALISLLVAGLVVGGFVWIVLSFRAPKKAHWHDERNDVPAGHNMPSFEVFSTKEKRSRQLEAANKD